MSCQVGSAASALRSPGILKVIMLTALHMVVQSQCCTSSTSSKYTRTVCEDSAHVRSSLAREWKSSGMHCQHCREAAADSVGDSVGLRRAYYVQLVGSEAARQRKVATLPQRVTAGAYCGSRPRHACRAMQSIAPDRRAASLPLPGHVAKPERAATPTAIQP